MDALPNVNLNRVVVGVSLPLQGKRADMPIAVLVNIIDNPSLAGLALGRNPFTLSYRHIPLRSVAAGNMSHYVAQNSAGVKAQRLRGRHILGNLPHLMGNFPPRRIPLLPLPPAERTSGDDR